MQRETILGMRMWPIILTISTLVAIPFLLAGFRFSGPLLFGCIKLPLTGAIAGRLLMRYRETYRFDGIVESIFQVPLLALPGVMICYLAATSGATLVDDKLLHVDRSLGYDWQIYARFAADHPAVYSILHISYSSGLVQPAIIAIALHLYKREGRFEKFIISTIISLAVTALIFSFYPATTAWTYLGQEHLAAVILPDLPLSTNSWISDLLQVRANGGYVMRNASGIIAFPSYHCVAALLNLWAIWTVRPLRLPFLLLDMLMIASAPLVGGHYVADLIGGAVVALLSVLLAGKAHGWLIASNWFRLPAVLDPQPVAIRG